MSIVRGACLCSLNFAVGGQADRLNGQRPQWRFKIA